jgi:pimeloyl-ACP methyl ester carboxylesterase
MMTSAPPGLLIRVADHALHLHCLGSGAPAVILDAALGASSLSWSLVQPAISAVTQCCAYDRAGFGWSEAGPLPRTADRIADELHLLLQHASIPSPYVLVGHSLGGLVVRVFASRHPEMVAGLVLIEPAIAEDWVDPSPERRLLIARGTRLCRYGGMAARAGLARVVTALVSGGAVGAARVLVKIISRGGLRRADEEILSPIWKLPAEARAVLQQMWTQPKFFHALGSQIENISASAALVLREASGDLGDLPLVVMSGASADEPRLKADAALAARSRRGRHVLVPNTGHWIPLDAPQAVTDVVTLMVHDIRSALSRPI